MKDKVLIFNGYYLPAKNYGGPATSIYNLVENCFDKLDFYIIVLNHDYGEEEPFCGITKDWMKVGHANVLYVDDNAFTITNIKRWLEDIKPNVVYLGGILSPRNLKYVFACRSKSVPVIIPPRGEICEKAVEIKAYKKKPYLCILKLLRIYNKCFFHTTAENETDGLKKYLGITNNRIYQLPNISRPIKQNKKNTKIEGRLKAVYLARICSSKNLKEALRSLKNVKREVDYSIYGTIEDKDYWDECQEIIKDLPSNIHVEYMGIASPTDVETVFSNSECFLFPTVTENYGHSIAESLSNGCPCIIPRSTTPWDDINHICGETYELGNINELADKIEFFAGMNDTEYQSYIERLYEYMRKRIDNSNVIEKYLEMFTKVGT